MALGAIYNAYPPKKSGKFPENISVQLVQVKRLQILIPIEQDIHNQQAREDNFTSLNSKWAYMMEIH